MIDIHCDECIWHHKKFPGAIALTLCNKVVLFCRTRIKVLLYFLLHCNTVLCCPTTCSQCSFQPFVCLDLSHCSLWRTFLQNKQQKERKKKRKKKAKPTKQTKKQNKNKNYWQLMPSLSAKQTSTQNTFNWLQNENYFSTYVEHSFFFVFQYKIISFTLFT